MTRAAQCYFYLFILFLRSRNVMSSPQVTVLQGKLQGVTLTTDSGFSYNAFLGIPYAKPPIGNLKFKEPQPAEDWEGTRDATVVGDSCPQIDIFFKKAFIGVEDCLYLNVYVPESASADAELPVMFWIHGGGFSSGSGSKEIYGPDYLVENDVILVTINYRLGPFGFFCLNNSEVPGNAGLKDQVLALKWVKDNIKKFGGNADNITIFGQSAGASSVDYIMMSPTSKGLFNKVINQSGTSVNEWSGPVPDPVGNAFKLGELLGLKTDKNDELLSFLANIPAETLVKTSLAPGIAFGPVIEQAFPQTHPFITEDPMDLLKAGQFKRVPMISGFTSNEGVLNAMKLEGLDVETLTLDILVPDFETYIPKYLKDRLNSELKKVVANKIKDFYFTDGNLVLNFFNMMTDYSFVKDIDWSTKLASQFMPSVYYYRFSYSGSLNVMKLLLKFPYEGAAHADELGYLFKASIEGIIVEATELDTVMLKRMSKMWTNFAKSGNPTPQLSEDIKTIWKPITKNEINCLDINEEFTLIQNPFEERMQFWENLSNIV